MTAVHGDEGDDQHGLKVHEVHDMQPGCPSHKSSPASRAVGLLPLIVSPVSSPCLEAPAAQAGKLNLTMMHDLRPAGVILDQRADQDQVGSQSGHSGSQSAVPNCPIGLPGDPPGQLQDKPSCTLCVTTSGQLLPDASIATQTEAAKAAHEQRSMVRGTRHQPPGMHAQMKPLLRYQDGNPQAGDGVECNTAQALTQAEVIEAQTADQEKPSVGFFTCLLSHGMLTCRCSRVLHSAVSSPPTDPPLVLQACLWLPPAHAVTTANPVPSFSFVAGLV